MTQKWRSVQEQIRLLPKGDTSEADRSKLESFNELIADQLRQYGFMSVPIQQLTLSPDSYRPEYDGFDLQTSISASDLIRTIWAYLNGLLELSRKFETNHPGLLVFDEPKQQSAKDVSFEELLRRVSASVEFGQQVIFATSEKQDRLRTLLSGISHNYFAIDGRVLQPVGGVGVATPRI